MKDFENQVSFSQSGVHYDFNGAGFKYADCPLYITHSSISYLAKIDFKDNKYRVTISDIKTHSFEDYNLGEITLISDASATPVEYYYLKKKNTVFRKTYKENCGKITDNTFDSLFELKEAGLVHKNYAAKNLFIILGL